MMATTNLGRVRPVPRGAWDAQAAYRQLDIVSHEGSSYLCARDCAGVSLGDGAYWLRLAAKGDAGSLSGAQLAALQGQIDALVADGDSSPEAAQARVSPDGFSYYVLKERLDEADRLARALASRRESNSSRRRMPLCTIIDDDARGAFKTFGPALAAGKGIPVACAIPTGFVGTSDYMSWAEIEDLRRQYADIEFLMHGHSHVDLSALPLADALADVDAARAMMRAHGLPDDKLVYPFNLTTSNLREALRPLLRCAFSGTGYTAAGYNLPPLQTYNITRVGLQRSDAAENMTLAQMQALIDEAIANDGWLVWVSHCYLTTMPMSQIEAMIDYAKAAGMRFVTIEEGLNRIGNVLEAGSYPVHAGKPYTLIDANGTMYSNSFSASGPRAVVNAAANAFTAADLPSAFEADCLTINYVDNAHAADLPGAQGGILETYRLSGGAGLGLQRISQTVANQAWWRRIISGSAFGPWVPLSPIARAYAPATAPALAGSMYVDTASQKVYVAMATDSTSDWKEITGEGEAASGPRAIVYAAANAFTNADLPSAFEADCLTINYVDNAHATGLPGSQGGILQTYRLSGGAGLGIQKISQTIANQEWWRRITSSSAFGTWVPLSPIARAYAPATAPAAAGAMYVDTAAQKLYVAMGTSAVSDWKAVALA